MTEESGKPKFDAPSKSTEIHRDFDGNGYEDFVQMSPNGDNGLSLFARLNEHRLSFTGEMKDGNFTGRINFDEDTHSAIDIDVEKGCIVKAERLTNVYSGSGMWLHDQDITGDPEQMSAAEKLYDERIAGVLQKPEVQAAIKEMQEAHTNFTPSGPADAEKVEAIAKKPPEISRCGS